MIAGVGRVMDVTCVCESVVKCVHRHVYLCHVFAVIAAQGWALLNGVFMATSV